MSTPQQKSQRGRDLDTDRGACWLLIVQIKPGQVDTLGARWWERNWRHSRES